MQIKAQGGILLPPSTPIGGKIGGIVSQSVGSTALKGSDPSWSGPSNRGVVSAQSGAARGSGATGVLGTADPLREGLFEALADIGGTVQAGLPGAHRDPSMVAVGEAATLRLRATVERYFQF